MTRRVDIAIIGAGFAGLAAAWRLDEAGLTDLVVLERANEVGGTWRDNAYPGAACDIRSDLYSLSFAPNPDWSRAYGSQSEIFDYLKRVSRQHAIRERIAFGCELQQATWNADERRWDLRTSTGPISARVLLSGHGPFSDPHLPAIEGLHAFTGAIMHSSRWDHAVDTADKRVAVIGTGASSIQIVPALSPTAARLTVFQRTAPWIIPRGDRATGRARRRLFAAIPALQRASRSSIFAANDVRWFGFTKPRVGRALERFSAHHLRSQVRDPELRERLTPDYRIGCKRVLVSDDFYPALGQPNVALVTEPILRIESDAIVTASGSRVPVDVIVLATGFDATSPGIARRIVGGAGTTLAQTWAGGMFALRGAAVPGYPNLFFLHGPNAALSHNSAVYMIEAQVDYVVRLLRRAPRDAVMEADVAATTDYNAWLDRSLARGVWSTGGCSSFYLDRGRNTVLWPRRAVEFSKSMPRLGLSEYAVS